MFQNSTIFTHFNKWRLDEHKRLSSVHKYKHISVFLAMNVST